MAAWPQTPTWTPTSDINGGNQYVPADGITNTDFNAIIQNLMWLRKYKGPVAIITSGAYVVDNTLYVTRGE